MIQEVVMATAGPRAISCNQRWDPDTRWASWRFVPYDRRLGVVRGLLTLPLLSSAAIPSSTLSMARLPGWDSLVFEGGFPWTGSREWSSAFEYVSGALRGLG